MDGSTHTSVAAAGRDVRTPVWIGVVAAAVFLVHAGNYLYFFVDDEAIPFVYAQNLLHGRGLSYNAIEGVVEGYSDFLHVLWSTIVLTITHAAQLPKTSVFFIGKGVGLSCGVAIVTLVWMILRRTRSGIAGSAAGLGIVALAGPLAVWSCSSLEAVPFALLTTALVASLASGADRWAMLTAIVLVLERIDGFVYASVLVAAFAITANASRRREIWRRIVVPLAAVFVVYHGWRWWYFRALVPTPLEAKILYKLTRQTNLVVKAPDESYIASFIHSYGWPAAVALSGAALYVLRRGGSSRPVVLAAVPLAMYVSLMGDWMFGFRFFVPLVPLFALIVASAVAAIGSSRPQVAAGLSVCIVCYCGIASTRFLTTYSRVTNAGSFLHSPSRDLHRFFYSYYGLYETARRLIPRGETIAYNQAGFVPFMLDLNNIDDLGICSRFPAEAPTTDLFFTEVGRYVPLTNKRALKPVEAYLLYRNVRFVVARTDILARANGDVIPRAILANQYELVGTDADDRNTIYRRSEQQARQTVIDPWLFMENVAHVSYLRDVRIGERRIDSHDYIAQLPFLHDEAGAIMFTGTTELFLRFSDRDEQVSEISIEEIRMSHPAEVRVRLLAADGRQILQTALEFDANRGRAVIIDAGRQGADRLVIDVSVEAGVRAQMWIKDLRVRGQRAALAAYIATHLRFPPRVSSRQARVAGRGSRVAMR